MNQQDRAFDESACLRKIVLVAVSHIDNVRFNPARWRWRLPPLRRFHPSAAADSPPSATNPSRSAESSPLPPRTTTFPLPSNPLFPERFAPGSANPSAPAASAPAKALVKRKNQEAKKQEMSNGEASGGSLFP